jgi:hypothetical protein
MRTASLLFASLLLLLPFVSTAEAEPVRRPVVIVDEVVYWPVVMPGGQIRIDVQVPESVVGFTNNCETISQMSTPQIYNEIALAAIEKGLSEGWLSCTTNCTGSNVNVRIWTSAYVQRSGSGCATELTPCNPSGEAWRDYEVCCGGQSGPVMTLVAFGTNGNAVSGCELTVPGGSGGIQ